MGIIRKHSRAVLLLIVVIQLVVIVTFVYTDKISSVSTTKNITAVVAEGNDRHLLIQGVGEFNLIDIEDSIRYINHDDRQIHLFNKKKEYVTTLQFDEKLENYQEIKLDNINYIETNFVCKRSICMIQKSTTDSFDGNVQIFSAKNQQYIYLDADKL